MAEVILKTQEEIEQDNQTQFKRQEIHRVMIDSTALLNIVKHCRDSSIKAGVQGSIAGVLKSDDKTLFIT
jgi:hypothetical protein